MTSKFCSNPGDSPETTMRNKTTEFLTDAAERIIVMTKVYTRFPCIYKSCVRPLEKKFYGLTIWINSVAG